MRGIKAIFDPDGQLNPGKVLPAGDADWAAAKPLPNGVDFDWDSLTVTAPADDVAGAISRRRPWRAVSGFPWGVAAARCRRGLGRGRTWAQLVAHLLTGPALLAAGTARDFLLELWAVTGDGRRFHAGAPVFKNVAGYDLAHLLCGSGRHPGRAVGGHLSVASGAARRAWRLTVRRRRCGTRRIGPVVSSPGGECGGRLADPTLIRGPETDGGDGTCKFWPGGTTAPWDLPRSGRGASDLTAGFGLRRRRDGVADFAGAASLLGETSSSRWCPAATDWTVLAAPEGASPAWLPDLAGGLVWQASPRLVWTPEPVTDSAGWHADRCRDQGRAILPPAPEARCRASCCTASSSSSIPTPSALPPWLEQDAHA